MKRQILGLLLVVPFTACGAPQAGSAATSSPMPVVSSAPTPVASPKPSPAPQPEFSTPQQFASVIAMKERDWREVIEGAFDCRMDWLAQDTSTDPIVGVRSMSCHLREATITMTAQSAVEELRSLAPDPSMESLVDKTLLALEEVVRADVYGQCGTGETLGEACDGAHIAALRAYSSLETVLDGWAPYL